MPTTTPEIAAASVPATGADAAVTAPFFDPNRPPLTPLPDPPRELPDIAPQMPDLTRALSVLENHYRHRPNAVVMGNCYLYKNPTLLDGQLYPHCLVSFGMTRPNAEITVATDYTISELGKPPDFVLDIASKYTWPFVYPFTREIYAEFGVPEYWRFDHTGGAYYDAALAGDRLTPAGVYEPIPVEQTPEGLYRGYSAALGLELHWYNGQLRFWNPDTG